MSYTMEDFKRDYVKQHFSQLTPEERQEALALLPPKERLEILGALPAAERLAGLSAKQIRQYLDKLTADRPAETRKPRRKR